MKTSSEELKPMLNELVDIFKNYRVFNEKKAKKLEKLGFKVTYNTKHYKMYINRNNKTYMVVISTTPSDAYTGNQTLRAIRRIYEQEGE
jgi:hypothetical protein